MMQNQLFKVFVIVFLLGSCKIDRKPAVDRDKFSFNYTDDSFLFFKNVRQIYYDIQDLPKAKWLAYRYSDRPDVNDRPSLNPVIVVDWDKKETYVLIESNDLLSTEASLSIREVNKSTKKAYTYSLSERGRENMLEFATKIYEAIMAGNEISVKCNGKYIQLFLNEDEREVFRVVMADYYRLTNVFGKK